MKQIDDLTTKAQKFSQRTQSLCEKKRLLRILQMKAPLRNLYASA